MLVSRAPCAWHTAYLETFTLCVLVTASPTGQQAQEEDNDQTAAVSEASIGSALSVLIPSAATTWYW